MWEHHEQLELMAPTASIASIASIAWCYGFNRFEHAGHLLMIGSRGVQQWWHLGHSTFVICTVGMAL